MMKIRSTREPRTVPWRARPILSTTLTAAAAGACALATGCGDEVAHVAHISLPLREVPIPSHTRGAIARVPQDAPPLGCGKPCTGPADCGGTQGSCNQQAGLCYAWSSKSCVATSTTYANVDGLMILTAWKNLQPDGHGSA